MMVDELRLLESDTFTKDDGTLPSRTQDKEKIKLTLTMTADDMENEAIEYFKNAKIPECLRDIQNNN